MRKALLVALLAALVISGQAIAGTGTQEDPYGPGDHIAICHSGDGTNFVLIHPSASSGGPAGHEQHEADIFASYYFKQNKNAEVEFVEGQNTDKLALLETNCEAPDDNTTGTSSGGEDSGGTDSGAPPPPPNGTTGTSGEVPDNTTGGNTTGGTTVTPTGGDLPYTGLPVWIPLLAAAALIVTGIRYLRGRDIS